MKILRSIWLKTIAFLLLMACSTAMVAMGMNFTKEDMIRLESLNKINFKDTRAYQNELQAVYNKLCVLSELYLPNMQEDGEVVLSDEQTLTLRDIGLLDGSGGLPVLSEHFYYYVSDGEHCLTNEFLPTVTTQYIQSNFSTYYFRIKNQWTASEGDATSNLYYYYHYDSDNALLSSFNDDNADLTIYLAPENGYVLQSQSLLVKAVEKAKKILLVEALLAAAAFILILFQIFQTGSKNQPAVSTEGGGQPVLPSISGDFTTKARTIPIEVILLEMAACLVTIGFLASEYRNIESIAAVFSEKFLVFQLLFGIAVSIPAGLFFMGFLYLVRRIKQRNLVRSSLFYRILIRTGRGASKLWRNYVLMDSYKDHVLSKRMFLRQVVFFSLIAFSCLATVALFGSGLTFLALFNLLMAAVLVCLYIYQNNQDYKELSVLCEHISQLYQGNNDYQSFVSEHSPVAEESRQLNHISEGFLKSVARQVKAERTKIELVTNVSHDLKTPLTSIIGYVDLLSKQELNPEAADYVKILEQKADRLKKIVSDLFELAKITSGNEELKPEELDCAVLVKQVLADMEDAIRVSGKSIKINIEEGALPIFADGSKLYRVFQNLLDNALKYSMDGTRIFLDLARIGDEAVTTIKNTSSYELNFDKDEILERFTRADKSRSGEGNGLGLSIAKGFTEACGGRLAIDMDGDLFKVTVAFPLVKTRIPASPDK